MNNFELVESDARGNKTSIYALEDRCFYAKTRQREFSTSLRCKHANCPKRGLLKNGFFEGKFQHNHRDNDRYKYEFIKTYRELKLFALESDGDIKQKFLEKSRDVSLNKFKHNEICLKTMESIETPRYQEKSCS